MSTFNHLTEKLNLTFETVGKSKSNSWEFDLMNIAKELDRALVRGIKTAALNNNITKAIATYETEISAFKEEAIRAVTSIHEDKNEIMEGQFSKRISEEIESIKNKIEPLKSQW